MGIIEKIEELPIELKLRFFNISDYERLKNIIKEEVEISTNKELINTALKLLENRSYKEILFDFYNKVKDSYKKSVRE